MEKEDKVARRRLIRKTGEERGLIMECEKRKKAKKK